MLFNTLVAPHINVNDLEMIVVQWLIKPWQFVNEGDSICEVETTKAITTVETNYSGYIYPVTEERKYVKVGEPLAHLFPENDHKQLKLPGNKMPLDNENMIVTKRALALMEQYGLSISDFPNFSTVSLETVVAKVRELKPQEVTHD